MTQRPVPTTENPNLTVTPAPETRNEATSPPENRKETPGTPAPEECSGVPAPGRAAEDMDLSPLGLKDAPAQEEDEQSLVNPGNS
jgi:hypothetical protein